MGPYPRAPARRQPDQVLVIPRQAARGSHGQIRSDALMVRRVWGGLGRRRAICDV
ncbi:hypothetical protein B0H10DRAFT_2195945 [Mycena sp. CBHHK59/15]|nr:hypothetical protein B0H10DRAFT_2195945 [Mycena sp. CBHHK59/15]